jgi:hypothetical protein
MNQQQIAEAEEILQEGSNKEAANKATQKNAAIVAAHKMWLSNQTTKEALLFIKTHADQFHLAAMQGVLSPEVEDAAIRRSVVANKTLLTMLDILSDSEKFAFALTKYSLV